MAAVTIDDPFSLEPAAAAPKLDIHLYQTPEPPGTASARALQSSVSYAASPEDVLETQAEKEASPASSAAPQESAYSCNGALPLTAANSGSPPENLNQVQSQGSGLRASVSSLAAGKVRFHSIQKGAGIGKHTNGRGVGRASKLAQLEVAAEHIGTSSHHVLLTSPRLLRSPVRKKSPIRWFPRKKTESYLERKIRMLQEKEGNIASLDETLGAANPHLSRIEREKLAAQAAAADAMNSRKDALIEASWCRILKLAGIPCKLAILELQKAEKKAAAALAEAENHGVVLHHGPAEREPTSTSEAITASLDTAFDVDKEVTAAIKVALRHVSSVSEMEGNKEYEMDTALNNLGEMVEEAFSQAESQSYPEYKDDCICETDQMPEDQLESPRKSLTSRPLSQKPDKISKVQNSLVSLMVGRIGELSLEHQTALAGIVATRGLSALLKEQSLEQELNEKPVDSVDCRSHNFDSPKKCSDLGSILVKHVSRLQREIQAAKEIGRHPQTEGEKRPSGRLQRVSHVESLDQILVKHVSKLEKEKLAAQASKRTPPEKPGSADSEICNELCQEVAKEDCYNASGRDRKKLVEVTNSSYSGTNLGSILVKHEQAASYTQEQAGDLDKVQPEGPRSTIPQDSEGKLGSVQVNFSSEIKINQRSKSNDIPGLGSILVKHVSRLEKEKQMALALQDAGRQTEKPKQSPCGLGLGDILVKRLSKLEIEKAKSSKCQERDFYSDENVCPATEAENCQTGRAPNSADAPWQTTKAQKSRQLDGTWGGPSMLRDVSTGSGGQVSSNVPRRKSLREKQLEDSWGGLSLGNALKRHVSKLEKEQAAWRRAEEEARRRPNLQH